MWKDVGTAVPKTTQTRYMDSSVERTTQVTPSLHHFFFFVFCTKMFPVISQQSLDTRLLGSYSEVKLSDATLILGGAVSFGREMHNAA